MVYLAHQSRYPAFGVIYVMTRNLKNFRPFQILVGLFQLREFLIQTAYLLILGIQLALESGIAAFDGVVEINQFPDFPLELLNQSGIVLSHTLIIISVFEVQI